MSLRAVEVPIEVSRQALTAALVTDCVDLQDVGLNLIGVQNGSPECCLDLLVPRTHHHKPVTQLLRQIMLFYIQKMTEPGVDVRQFDFEECHTARTVPFPQQLCGFLTSPELCQQLAELGDSQATWGGVIINRWFGIGILNSNGANVLKAHVQCSTFFFR